MRLECGGRSHVDDPAFEHDREPVRDAGDEGQVVGHEEHADAEAPLLQVDEQPDDLRLHQDIEAGGGLVRHDQLRLVGQGDRDDDALAHAAGKLVRIGAKTLPRQLHHVEELLCTRFGLTLGRTAVQSDRLGQLRADGHDRVKRVHGALRHERDALAAQPAQLLLAHAEKVGAIQQNPPAGDRGRRLEKPEHGERGGCFPRSRFADQTQDLALPDVECDPVDRAHDVAEVLVEDRQVAHGQLGGRVGEWRRVRRAAAGNRRLALAGLLGAEAEPDEGEGDDRERDR